MMRQTNTYAIMHVSSATMTEIRKKIQDAGYHHAFHEREPGGTTIDMHGIALQQEPESTMSKTTDEWIDYHKKCFQSDPPHNAHARGMLEMLNVLSEGRSS